MDRGLAIRLGLRLLLFVIRRLAQAALVLVVVSAIVFLMSRASGDPAIILMPLEATEAQRQAFREKWNLDAPLHEQFVTWGGNVLRGDFGQSFRSGLPVTTLLKDRMGNSVRLALSAVVIASVVGVSTGVLAALKRGTWLDGLFRSFAFFGQGMPSFWLALILLHLFAIQIPIFPVGGAGSSLSFVLPSLTLAWLVAAGIMRLVRSSMLEALGSDYIVAARSRGSSESTVIFKHAVRNAMMSPLTYMGQLVGILIGSAIVIETIFAWPGLGTLAHQSVLYKDFPTLQGVVLVITAGVVLSSLIVDALYAVVDPRLRRA